MQIATEFASVIFTQCYLWNVTTYNFGIYSIVEIINIIQNNILPIFHISDTKFQQFESINEL